MKIFLLGDHSSFHNYLKDGLLERGHSVIMASSGDGYKKIGGVDIELPKLMNPHNIGCRCEYYNEWIKLCDRIKDYDVVQFISSTQIPFIFSSKCFDKIKNNNRIVSLTSVGSNYEPIRSYKSGKLEYSGYGFYKSRYYNKTIKGLLQINASKHVERFSDVIIPMTYEYKFGYENYTNLYKVIPAAINCSKIDYNENVVKDRVVIYHGITRPELKGSGFIIDAMEKLKNNYPNDVEIIYTERLSFDDYMKIMKRANVYIDACTGYGYGIAACIAMARGKITLSGFRKEVLYEQGVKQCPGICLRPNTEFIYNQLKELLERKNEFAQIGEESRKYIEKVHNHIAIADQYVEAWNTIRR